LSMIGQVPVTNHVMIGTLPPQDPSNPQRTYASLVPQVNSLLMSAVPSRGATLVDLYSDMSGNIPAWISSVDGLHPTPAGYQEMARVWFNAIRNAYEVTASRATTTAQSPLSATSGSSRAARRAGR